MKESAIRLLDGKSKYEDLSPLFATPQWKMLNHFPKLSSGQRLIIAALINGADNAETVEREAGLFGAYGLTPSVKAFWRKIAMRIISVEPYRSEYKTKLGDEWKKNERLEFKALAATWIDRVSKEDKEAFYEKGMLSPDHLKLRARMCTLSVFIRDLFEFMETAR